ncbi:MAG: hypothetical protein ABW034_05170 [Steroidobacteraceae bacterium]
MTMKTWHTIVASLSVGAALTLGAGPRAHADDDVPVDVTQNPGCGVTLKTKEEKIARNKRLAQYYFQGWNSETMKQHDRQYRFEDHDCFASDATFRMGFGLEPEPPEFVKVPYRRPSDRPPPKASDSPFMKALPNWGTVPGTLRIVPWENGCYFIMRFGGNTPSGERIEFWEVDLIEINDAGKITHWEGYNDTLGVDRLFRVAFGKSVKELGRLENMMRPPPGGEAAPKAGTR